jgi:hypothetical protein
MAPSIHEKTPRRRTRGVIGLDPLTAGLAALGRQRSEALGRADRDPRPHRLVDDFDPRPIVGTARDREGWHLLDLRKRFTTRTAMLASIERVARIESSHLPVGRVNSNADS